jgi:hypothetical protein
MESKLTAVQWLQERYNKNINLMPSDFDQAKAMEKEQIIDFAENFSMQDHCTLTAEQYYNKTFTERCQ